MARVEVHGADVADGRISKLRVRMFGIPPRTIDRDTTLAWMKDGHSLVPVRGGVDAPALLLVDVDGEEGPFVRDDTEKTAADKVELPSVGEARV